MTTSPTTLSLKALRDAGYVAAVVEHFNPHKRIRQDLFGFIDIIAIRPGETLAVQTTSRSNMAARVRKIADHPNVAAVREAGWAIHVHGWKKNDKGRWECRTVDVS